MKLGHKTFNSSQFRIKLTPQGGSSKDVVVTTTGVSGTLPGGAGTSYTWLDGSGSYNSTAATSRKIILCVPDGLPVGTTFKFDVDVGGIGGIDPRVDVK